MSRFKFLFLRIAVRQKFKAKVIITQDSPYRHDCVAFKLVYCSAGNCYAVYHAAHVVVQKPDDFARAFFAEPVLESVRDCSKTADIAEEDAYVLKMWLKVNFLARNCLCNAAVCKARKCIKEFLLILCTLVKYADFVAALSIKHSDKRCIKVTLLDFFCRSSKATQRTRNNITRKRKDKNNRNKKNYTHKVQVVAPCCAYAFQNQIKRDRCKYTDIRNVYFLVRTNVFLNLSVFVSMIKDNLAAFFVVLVVLAHFLYKRVSLHALTA